MNYFNSMMKLKMKKKLTISFVSFLDSSVIRDVFSLSDDSVEVNSDLRIGEVSVLLDHAVSLLFVLCLSLRIPPVFKVS